MKKNKLTFGDLEVGDRFIDFPTDGDNSGHGGYMETYNVFIKTDPRFTPHYDKNNLQMNAQCTANGTLSHFTDTMNIIKLN